MALPDQVRAICDRLSPLGWRGFLRAATGNSLDIKKSSAAARRQELIKNLPTIDRTLTGLDDFAMAGNSQRVARVGLT